MISSKERHEIDLSDLLIAYSAKTQGYKNVLTFYKKASKQAWFDLLK